MNCLIVGIDALDMKQLYKYLGKLPTFNRLIKNWSSGELESIQPTLSPVIWTTLATGKTRDKHGIKDFVDEKRHLITSTMRKVPAFWNITSHYGLKTGIVGWWNTNPVENINGIMVSDKNNYKIGPSFFPNKISAEAYQLSEKNPGILPIKQILGSMKDLSMIELDWFKKVYYSDMENYLNFLKFVNNEFEVSAIYFRGLDIITHLFLGRKKGSYYRYLVLLDTYVKSMIHKLNPETVFIVSDHGGHQHETPKLLIEKESKLNQFLKKVLSFNGSPLVKDIPQFKNSTRKLRYNHKKYSFTEVTNKLQTVHTVDGTPLFIGFYNLGQGLLGAVFNARIMGKYIKTNEKSLINPSDYLIGTNLYGDHRKYGTIIAYGKNIKKGHKIKGMSVLDFLPTLLYCLGLPIEESMNGKIYEDMFTKSNPKKVVKMYEFWGIEKHKLDTLEIDL